MILGVLAAAVAAGVDPGGIAIVVVAILAVPLLLMSGAVIAAALGWALKDNAEATHEGSELIDLNR